MGAEATTIRVLCVDDHPLLRQGIGALVGAEPDMVLVAQAASGRRASSSSARHRPDVTLLDLRLPDMSGVDALRAIRAEFPEARVLMLTTFEGDVEMQRALEAGARGYLLKTMPPAELIDAIRQVHAGKKRIPPAVAAQLAEHLADEALTPARDRGAAADRGGQSQQGHRRPSLDLGGDGEGPRQAHHGQARRQRPHRSGRGRHPPRHHRALARGPPKGLAHLSPLQGFAAEADPLG